jgi:outer membrane protein assembly factor BamB
MRTRVAAACLSLVLAVVGSVHAWTFTDNELDWYPSYVAVAPDGDIAVVSDSTVVMLDAVMGVEAWRAEWPVTSPSFMSDVAVLPTGNVVASGSSNGLFRVSAFDGATGAPIWDYPDSSGGGFGAAGIVTTPDGDVIAVGFIEGVSVKARLDGATGTELWRHDGPTSMNEYEPALDADGDFVFGTSSSGSWGVAKRSGADGALLWSVQLGPQCGFAPDVATDPGGNVFATYFSCSSDGNPMELVKLSGVDGAELWRRVDPRPGGVPAIPPAVLPSGDVVVGSAAGDDLQVIAVSSVTGVPLWQWNQPHGDYLRGVRALAVDGAGDVVAVGGTENPVSALIVKLDGSTGAELWRHRAQGAISGFANHVVVDAEGDVIAALGAWRREYQPPDEYLVVRKIDGADGESFVGTRCGSAVCGRCSRCDAPGVCSVGPRPDCRVPFTAKGSLLQLKLGNTHATDRLLWKWGDGPSTLPAELGDPRLVSDEVLCIFDDATDNPALLVSDSLAAFEDCGRKECWGAQSGQPAKPTFGYKSNTQSPAGRSSVNVKLTAGPGKASRLLWKAKGPALGLDAALAIATPVRAELRSSTGVCWAANYDAGVVKNTTVEFKAQGGP